MPNLLFVFLGWVLGLLSTPIADAIRRRRDAREIAVALAYKGPPNVPHRFTSPSWSNNNAAVRGRLQASLAA